MNGKLNTATVKLWGVSNQDSIPLSLRTVPPVQADLTVTLVLRGCLPGYSYLMFQVGSMKYIPFSGDLGVRILMVASSEEW